MAPIRGDVVQRMRRLLSILLLLAFIPPLGATAASLDPVMRKVEAIRELRFTGPIRTATIKRSELTPYLRKQLEKDLPVSPDEYGRILESLQLIDRSSGAIDSLLDLYQAQVLAFYDPLAHVFYSLDAPPPGAEGSDLMQEAIEVHELTHALQDQHFDAGRVMEGLRDDWDAQMAYQSLLEGEATLVMLADMAKPMGVELDDVVANSAMLDTMGAMSQAGMAGVDAPRYFVQSLAFPYLQGLRFVSEAYRRGGWKAVDALYANPPRSTAEIIHPELYGHAKAGAPGKLLPPSKSASLLDTPLGEFHWRFLLGADAVRGWEADEARVTRVGPDLYRVETATRWDSPEDATTFADALRSFLGSRGVHADVRVSATRVAATWGAAIRPAATFGPVRRVPTPPAAPPN
ncbi:MAG: hypothetical protein WBX15_09035 [Thermoanaerobaculia bacterium]